MQARKADRAPAMGMNSFQPFTISGIQTPGRVDVGKVEDVEELVNIFTSSGMSVAIIIYFLYKDYRFNENIIDVLSEVREVLAELKTYHKNGG